MENLEELALEIIELKNKYPNDAELGKHVRALINDKINNEVSR